MKKIIKKIKVLLGKNVKEINKKISKIKLIVCNRLIIYYTKY